MTTIAYDGVSVCSDSLVTNGSSRVGYTRKIFPIPGGGVAAMCGPLDACHEVVEWLSRGAKQEERPKDRDKDTDASLEILWVRGPGDAVVINQSFRAIPWEAPYAGGTGADFALAAMLLGKSAKEAVKLACKLDCFSGGKVVEVKIKDAAGKRSKKK